MSSRIVQAYSGFLAFEEQMAKTAAQTPAKKKEASAGLGLGARAKKENAPSNNGKYAQLERVAELVSAVREYREI